MKGAFKRVIEAFYSIKNASRFFVLNFYADFEGVFCAVFFLSANADK